MASRRDQAQLDAGNALRLHLGALKLPFMLENYQAFAQTAADKLWSHLDYLTELLGGEAAARDDRRVQINRMLVQNLFHPDFMPTRTASPSRRR